MVEFRGLWVTRFDWTEWGSAPQSKIDEFERIMMDGLAAQATMALLKLCYVDFDIKTDVRMVARSYINAYKRLGDKYPGVKFIAVTSPLTTVQTGPIALIQEKALQR